MGNAFKHKTPSTVSGKLYEAEYVGTDAHTAENVQDEDMLYYKGSQGEFIRATPAIIAALLDHGTLSGLSDDDHTQYTKKATFTAKGDIYTASAASTPTRVAIGSDRKALMVASGLPNWGASAVIFVNKTAPQIVNDSTTLVNDNHILFAVAANEVWFFEMFFHFNSSEVADLKVGWSVPSGTTMLWANNLAEGDTGVLNGTGADYHQGVAGLVWAGATPGNTQMQWSQNVAEATDTTMLTNAFLFYIKLA